MSAEITTQTPPTKLGPGRIVDLLPSERFMVWIFRNWIRGMIENDKERLFAVRTEVDQYMGEADRHEALALLSGLIDTIAGHANGPVSYHAPNCPCVGATEMWFLNFLRHCQAGDPERAAGLASRLVSSDGISTLTECGHRLSAVLTRNCIRLGSSAQNDRSPTHPASPTVH